MGEGLELARRYFEQVVGPLLAHRLPDLRYAAARLGTGSDLLGLDDAMSRDHDWGLRLLLLVDGADAVREVKGYLQRTLPPSFEGLPTRFATTWDPVVRHRVDVDTPCGFAASRLGVDMTGPLTALDWLSLTGQSVLEVTAGAVFTDPSGSITRIRRALAWYPDHLWKYVVAADWARLAQELPLVGRTGQRGDDVGSRVVASRLVGVALHLGFLLERRWPPYPKWLGTMFAALPSAAVALPALECALAATAWQGRQAALCDALEQLHDVQRATGLPTGDGAVEPFHDRPFRVVRAGVGEVLVAGIGDPAVRALPAGVGSLEQCVDNVDVLSRPEHRRAAMHGWRATIGSV